MGAIPFNQSRHQVAHATRSARQHSVVYLHQRGQMHDVRILDHLVPEPGAFYVMDRGYVDFERLGRLDDAGSFFVTRAKSNMKARRRYSRPVDRSTGLICDQTIVLTGFYTRQGFDRPLRRIKFNDPETGKSLVFLTNNFVLSALTIAKLYKYRWQVEIYQA
jgi:IS4 transposase